jgi:hypothetical protein
VARALAGLADEARREGWIFEARDARLAEGQARLKAHDPSARALLAALEAEARAAGDLNIAHRIVTLR